MCLIYDEMCLHFIAHLSLFDARRLQTVDFLYFEVNFQMEA